MTENSQPFRGNLYIFDILRYDYPSCNGYTESITPNIDRVAEDGMRDHGEIFDEHARLEHAGTYRTQVFSKILGEDRRSFYGVFEPSTFIGHQGIYPYDELIHIPLIIKTRSEGPEIPSISEKLIELVDVLPTMFDLADERPLMTIQGHSITDSITGQGLRGYCFSASELHNGNLKYYSIYAG